MIRVDIRYVSILILLSVVTAVRVAAQDGTPALTIRDGDRRVPLTVQQVSGLPQRSIEVAESNSTVRYEGVRLSELLARAGVPFDASTRGRRLTGYVIAAASDGFRAVIALAEIDPEFAERDILVALTRDGMPIPERDGPFRLVVAGDKLRGRWVRQLSTLTILQAPELP